MTIDDYDCNAKAGPSGKKHPVKKISDYRYQSHTIAAGVYGTVSDSKRSSSAASALSKALKGKMSK